MTLKQLILLLCIPLGVEGQRTVVAPNNCTISLNDTAVFSCAAFDVADINFIVKDVDQDVDPSDWTSRGIIQSDITFKDGFTNSSLMIFGTEKNNRCQIICFVYLSDLSKVVLQPAALLSIAGTSLIMQ